MDCQKPKSRKINPRENASILSILFYRYIFDIFRTGARKNLDNDDIYKVLEKLKSERLCERMEKEWNKELEKKHPSILKAFLRMFGIEYTLWGIGFFLFSMIAHNIVQPMMTGKLMTYFEPGHNVTKLEAFSYIVGIIAANLTFVIYDNTYYFSILIIGLKLRTACSSLIYKKCLKLNLSSNPEYNSGKAVTLITKDVSTFARAADYGHLLLVSVPHCMVVICVAYQAIGPAALVAAGFLIALFPLNFVCGKLSLYYTLKTAGKTDQRLKLTEEVLTAMRIIKMYTWEAFFSKCLNKLRLKEIKYLKALFYVKTVAICFGEAAARFAFYSCVITYISLGNYVTADKAFILVSSFGSLQSTFIEFIPLGMTAVAELQASLRRITSFLMLEEIPLRQITCDCSREISISDASVSTRSGSSVLKIANLNIDKGLTIVTGATGSGKSALLKLFIGDISVGDGRLNMGGSLSYASQEPWIFPATIRQNILFGEKFDQKRYEEVIKVCALEKDFKILPSGDLTLATDKGLNLSKGQKVRINLARAVYRNLDIYLIDDCFSSVDRGVARHIFHNCIRDFLRNKTCVLVTDNIVFMEYADSVLSVEEGVVKYIEKIKSEPNEEIALRSNTEGIAVYESSEKEDFDNEIDEHDTLLSKEKHIEDSMYKETNQEGEVKKKVYYDYCMSVGRFRLALVIICAVVAQATTSWADYFVSFWVDMERELSEFKMNGTTNSTSHLALQESHGYTMKLYFFVVTLTSVCISLSSFVLFMSSTKASENIHNSVLDKLLKTSIVFFDTHLVGNVLNRFSRDLGIIDEILPVTIYHCLAMLLSLVAVFVVISTINVFFIIPSIVLTIILYYGRRYYMQIGRTLRRLEGAARSPVIGYLSATMEGLSTIRANRVQEVLITEFNQHQDHYSSTLYMNLSTTFGFGLYVDLTSTCYIAAISFSFLFFKTDAETGKIGLAITQSMLVTGIMQWGVRMWSDLENHMTSTERILEYADVKTESISGKIIDNWPDKGSITYKNVDLSYAPHNEKVLKNITFKIEPNEKIGVIGRTGAGKTSIISTLYRMYNFDGTIKIDDSDITMLPVKHLRSNISVIPQDPVLFSGSVRSNLDPYSQYSDQILWNALEEVDMKKYVTALDNTIYEGGIDFSAGQKQLFCLARAILRDNKILILDEATANMDAQTASTVQTVIQRKFSGCTVITIAHKLNTILSSDKVLVMDSGKLIEFGHPTELLKMENGYFRTMVAEEKLM